MNPIESYQKAKQRLASFNRWANLLGKEYVGGTRGKGGEYGKIISAQGTLTIYFQEYDGANNYHDMEPDFATELAVAMRANGKQLLDTMREVLEHEVKKCAAEAKAFTEQINSDSK